MKRSTLSLLLLAGVLSAAGCQKSAINAGDAVSLQGRLLNLDGTPAANQTVSLFALSAAVVGGTCVVPLTLGGGTFRTATTDTTGHYLFSLTGADTQTSNGLALCFNVKGPDDASGRSASTLLTVQVDAVTVPDLRLWDDRLTVTNSGAAVSATWQGLSDAVGNTATGQSLQFLSGDQLAWTTSTAAGATSANVPTYVLEDFPVFARVFAGAESKGSGVIFQLNYLGQKAAISGVGVAAPSRGAVCTSPNVSLPKPCPLTDGKLDVANINANTVDFSLPLPIAAKHAVLRNVASSATISVLSSPDGVTFTQVGTAPMATAGYLDLPLSTSAVAGHYRIVVTNSDGSAGQLTSAAEISFSP